MAKTIYVCGHEQSGKTAFILSLAKYLHEKGRQAFLFKPFEKGVRQTLAEDADTDAEKFQAFNRLGSVNLHCLYSYQNNGVLAYLAQSELMPFQFGIYQERMKEAASRFAFMDYLIVELSGSLSEPAGENKKLANLILSRDDYVLWLFPEKPEKFNENFPNAEALAHFPNGFVLLNNTAPIRNPGWLEYLWQAIQECANIPVPNMMAYNPKLQTKAWVKVFDSCLELWEKQTR